MTDHNPLALASMLYLGSPDLGGGGCAAWVDSKGHQCDKPRKEGFLCARHHAVAVRRWESEKRKRKAQQVRLEAQRRERLEKHGDKWRTQLARVEAELERRTGMQTTDRAAFGGVGARQLRTAKGRGFSHSNVKRVGELIEQQKDLRQKLGIKERD